MGKSQTGVSPDFLRPARSSGCLPQKSGRFLCPKTYQNQCKAVILPTETTQHAIYCVLSPTECPSRAVGLLRLQTVALFGNMTKRRYKVRAIPPCADANPTQATAYLSSRNSLCTGAGRAASGLAPGRVHRLFQTNVGHSLRLYRKARLSSRTIGLHTYKSKKVI